VLQAFFDKGFTQLATDMKALCVGGWGAREGDLSAAVKVMKANMGGMYV
jgi:hypothetical protein